MLAGAGGMTGAHNGPGASDKYTTLVTWYTVTLNGGYTAAGCGMKYTNPSTITITGVPSGATIRKAFLYWAVQNVVPEQASFAQGTFNGNPIVGIKVGSEIDPCWGQDSSWAYRADVTAFVAGNGSYVLTGFYNQAGTIPVATGASLFVIYESASDPWVTVCVNEGNMDVPIGPLGDTARYDITGFVAEAPVSAWLSIAAQDGQNTDDGALFFNASIINPIPVFQGQDPPAGNFWDTRTWDVSSLVNDGESFATVTMAHPGSGDCVNLIASCFSVTAPSMATGEERATGTALSLIPAGKGLCLMSGLRQDVRLTVYDAGGRLVATRDMKGLETGEYRVDFSGLGQGVFMVAAESSLGARAGARMVLR